MQNEPDILPGKFQELKIKLENKMARNDINLNKECKPKDFHRFVSEEQMKLPPPYAKNSLDNKFPSAKPKNNDIDTFQKEVESQLNPSVIRRQ